MSMNSLSVFPILYPALYDSASVDPSDLLIYGIIDFIYLNSEERLFGICEADLGASKRSGSVATCPNTFLRTPTRWYLQKSYVEPRPSLS